MHFRSIFVTVGTTEFDKLIQKITSEEFAKVLKKIGCNHLIIQYGNGKDIDIQHLETAGICVDEYRMKQNISEDIKNVDLVISHAGAGTCKEVLQYGKPMIVIINEDLMDNHQSELAEQLAKDGYLYHCIIDTLEATMMQSNFDCLKPYPKGDLSKFMHELDALMGFAIYHEE